jgi:hypothetical protein
MPLRYTAAWSLKAWAAMTMPSVTELQRLQTMYGMQIRRVGSSRASVSRSLV